MTASAGVTARVHRDGDHLGLGGLLAHQVQGHPQVRGDQRADVRAVGVDEGHEHGLAPVGVDVHGLAEVVAERQRRGGRRRAELARGLELLRARGGVGAAAGRGGTRAAAGERERGDGQQRRPRSGQRLAACGSAPGAQSRAAKLAAHRGGSTQAAVGAGSSIPATTTHFANKSVRFLAVRAESLAPRGRGSGDPMRFYRGGESPHLWRSVAVYASPTANPVGAKQRRRKDRRECRDPPVILPSLTSGTTPCSARWTDAPVPAEDSPAAPADQPRRSR